jgi:myo-inositol 2-dehydrogenase/D-chiro-inositol 1-dehydrogenase
MKFGVIGTGMMGCEHIRNLAHIPNVELIAVSDPNPTSRKWARKACGETFTPAVYADYQQLLDEKPEAVIIASPNYTHIDVMRELMKTDIHVLLEKPMCTCLTDARELVALSEQREALTWVALEYRYMAATQQFLARLPLVGDLKMLFIREHRFPFLEKVAHWNRFNEFTGGTLVEKCCHFFDLMNLAIGAKPLRVMASGGQDVNHMDENYAGRTPDILDNAFVIIEYENGARACLDLCMFAEGSLNEQELVATGSKAKLEVHIPDNQLTLSWRDKRPIERHTVETDPRVKYAGFHHGASYLEQLEFINAINDKRPATITTRDGYWSVAIGIAAQQSIQQGSFVDIESP